MKRTVKYEYVDFQEQLSLKCSSYRVSIDDVIPLHQHPEWEISVIQKGSGTVVTGDSAKTFSVGTITIVPPMIPHCWIFNRTGKAEEDMTENTTIHFKENLLENLMAFKEFQEDCHILKVMNKALTWDDTAAEGVYGLILAIKNQSCVDRLFSLIRILGISASKVRNKEVQDEPLIMHTDEDGERIGKVIKYVASNYMNRITLEEAAAVASMSKTRFCAYFKQSLRQTFFSFLNQYRIEIAIYRLTESRISIADLCFEVGFNDIPHFIRTFKKYKGCSPKAYLNRIKNCTVDD